MKNQRLFGPVDRVICTHLSCVSHIVFCSLNSSRSCSALNILCTSVSWSTTQLLNAFLCDCRCKIFSSMVPACENIIDDNINEYFIAAGRGSGSGSYSGGLTWSIVLRCDDHTGLFTCDGCARDPYFYVPAETQSYVIKLSCSRKVLAASGD